MSKPLFSGRIDEFHQTASQLMDYSDFGNDDNYYQNLQKMLQWADSDATWTELGLQSFPQRIIGLLCGRLAAQKGFEQFPDCLEAPIKKPIIVVGFRSGTTAFHKLLASIPDTQTLEFWLASSPMPRPPRDTWEGFPPFENVRAGLAQMSQMIPNYHAIHSMSADEADESHRADHSFCNPGQMETLWSPKFVDWTFQQDQTKAYQRFYKVLQLIGYQNPSKWVLKCPFHMGFTELTQQTFPDATLVHTYRDPSEIIPSVCSITYKFLSPFQTLDKHTVGKFVLDFFGTLLDSYIEAQAKLDPASFHDIDYRDIVSDPVDCVRQVYEKNEGSFSDEQAAIATAHHNNNRQGKHGKHDYSAEEFGLSRDMIRDRMHGYLDYYAI